MNESLIKEWEEYWGYNDGEEEIDDYEEETYPDADTAIKAICDIKNIDDDDNFRTVSTSGYEPSKDNSSTWDKLYEYKYAWGDNKRHDTAGLKNKINRLNKLREQLITCQLRGDFERLITEDEALKLSQELMELNLD